MQAAVRFRLLSCAAALATLILSTSASAVGSTDPALCLQGGWQTLQKADGRSFGSEQACNAYAVHGGVLYRPILTIIPQCSTTDHVASELAIFASGFPAGSPVTLTLEGALWTSTGTNVLTSTTAGPHSFEPGTLIGQPGITPTDHFLTLTVRSAEGVTATAGVRTGCPFP
jgi:hypothetical protein